MDIRQFILPTGVGLTHIKVYADAAPAGGGGGAPSGGAHVHLVCSEIYYILKGKGQVELLSMEGVELIDVEPCKAVCFRPGIVHRVLNPHGDLEVLAIMQHGGLPERQDFVMTFPSVVMGSAEAYGQAARAATHGEAIKRRDLSLAGFVELKGAFARSKEEGREALQGFYRAARGLIAPKVEGFEWVLKVGAQAELKNSLDACDFIRSGRTDYLEAAEHAVLFPTAAPATPGKSGEVHSYALEESFLSDGRKVA